MDLTSAKKKIEIQTWQEASLPCDHTRNLQQDSVAGFAARSALNKCSHCDMTDNLWLCMTCGSVGCGRRQFDGTGGNGHAAEHAAQNPGHVISLKLGTITPEGSADIFCYTCDEMREDPDLSKHLSLFGIHVDQTQKTAKSMAELQLEQNLKYDFSMATGDGQQFEPANGLGLVNLGNSCYMASILQVCLGIEAFRNAFSDPTHFIKCSKDAGTCFICQMTKLQLAARSGESIAVAPWMLKAVASSGHAEFASGQQQDAAEFMAHLLKVIQRNDGSSSALQPFNLTTQQCLSCTCGKKRCQSQSGQSLPISLAPCIMEAKDPLDPQIDLTNCISKSFETVPLEMKCNGCNGSSMSKELYLTKLPNVLVLPLSRYVVENWVPKKLDIPVTVPMTLDLSAYTRPAQSDSKEETSSGATNAPQVDELALQQLISMGFSQAKCTKALLETGSCGPEPAMEWLFQHMDDPEPESQPNGDVQLPPEMIEMLMAAGFSEAASKAALLSTDLDVERAFDYALSHPESVSTEMPEAESETAEEPLRNALYDLTAFISHKGPSIHCGHYVAYRKDSTGRWILCNDAKLAYVPDDSTLQQAASTAYIYFYTRRQ